MKRLTKMSESGNAYYHKCFEKPCSGMGECLDDNCDLIYEACKELAEYENLEEQGLLIKLPCKIGDTVFIIVGKDISKQTIREMTISNNGLIIFKTKRRTFNTSWFGKDVFTTYKEAEMELKNRWEK